MQEIKANFKLGIDKNGYLQMGIPAYNCNGGKEI
jgi:hypothetical protein